MFYLVEWWNLMLANFIIILEYQKFPYADFIQTTPGYSNLS